MQLRKKNVRNVKARAKQECSRRDINILAVKLDFTFDRTDPHCDCSKARSNWVKRSYGPFSQVSTRRREKCEIHRGRQKRRLESKMDLQYL